MEKLTKLESCTKSASFGTVVNGRVNRVAVCVWSNNANEFTFVGGGEHYQGNMPVPERFGEDIASFMQAVQKAVDDGKLSVYAYQFSASVISDGTFKAYKNTNHPENQPIETFRRAWGVDNDPNFLGIVKAQVAKSVVKGKLVGVV